MRLLQLDSGQNVGTTTGFGPKCGYCKSYLSHVGWLASLMLCYDMVCYMLYAMLYALYSDMLCCALFYVMCYAMLYAMTCSMLCYAMLCYAVLCCYTLLYYAMIPTLCYAMLYAIDVQYIIDLIINIMLLQ